MSEIVGAPIPAGDTSSRLVGDPANAPQTPERIGQARARLDAALNDRDHPDHRAAVREMRRHYEREYGTAPAPGQPAALVQDPETGAVSLPRADPAEQARLANEVRGTILRRAGIRGDEAAALGELAGVLGLHPVTLQGIVDIHNPNATPEHARAALGRSADTVIAKAQAVLAERPGLAELIDHYGLGNNVALIRALADTY